MASTENSLDEYLYTPESSLEKIKPVEFQWSAAQSVGFTAQELGQLTTYNSTSHPSYGAVPNVTIGSGTSGTGTIWTTTGTTNPYTITGAGTKVEQGGTIKLQGKNADIDINGKSMTAWMEKVEERLNILTPNPEMEKDWDDLRRLGERYRKLEKKCQEKADMWKKLKSMPKPSIT